jgi:DNA-binding transcriptional regulator YdaS (Cro superfamily)
MSMTSEELKEAIERLYGYGGGKKLAFALGKSPVSISRQLNGVSKISSGQARLIREMVARRPESIADYL